ncbi:hypothetical protein PILCRDRAFT_3838 [Piloderma croceum F 1598]|uniref:Uncharacterized protein n=1 Tax=Piloderma croceum (strain F 1598) TaxID=765440 RepID=A0A0C3G9Q0_PILCF|nr:hypothetical protein PILCRDRAFT_3838 [Piloderma croceum F 1598]
MHISHHCHTVSGVALLILKARIVRCLYAPPERQGTTSYDSLPKFAIDTYVKFRRDAAINRTSFAESSPRIRRTSFVLASFYSHRWQRIVVKRSFERDTIPYESLTVQDAAWHERLDSGLALRLHHV